MTSHYPRGVAIMPPVDVLNGFVDSDAKINGNIREQIGKAARHGQQPDGPARRSTRRQLTVACAPRGLHEQSFDDVMYVPLRIQYAMANRVLGVGEPASDLVKLLCAPEGELVASRHRICDGLIGTALAAQLKTRGIEKLVFAELRRRRGAPCDRSWLARNVPYQRRVEIHAQIRD
jgi:hypothetical protein